MFTKSVIAFTALSLSAQANTTRALMAVEVDVPDHDNVNEASSSKKRGLNENIDGEEPEQVYEEAVEIHDKTRTAFSEACAAWGEANAAQRAAMQEYDAARNELLATTEKFAVMVQEAADAGGVPPRETLLALQEKNAALSKANKVHMAAWQIFRAAMDKTSEASMAYDKAQDELDEAELALAEFKRPNLTRRFRN